MGNMKANRKFVEEENDEAVSAVIGVILMVAITVAIAATVYYYVTVLTGGTTGSSAPTMAWSVDSANDNITITKCSPSDTAYGVAGTVDTINLVFKNGGNDYYCSENMVARLRDGAQTDANVGAVTAGDTISFSVATGSWSVVWEPTNEVLGSFSV